MACLSTNCSLTWYDDLVYRKIFKKKFFNIKTHITKNIQCRKRQGSRGINRVRLIYQCIDLLLLNRLSD